MYNLQVASLAARMVSQVSCGAWHTAAIASPRPSGPNVLDGLAFIERLTLQHKLAAMYEMMEEVSPPARVCSRAMGADTHRLIGQTA